MTADQSAKRAAHRLADTTGQTYTRALWALRAGDGAPWPVLEPGQRIRFAELSHPFTIAAVSADGRYAAATRTMFGRAEYTVLDLALGVRGTSDSWGDDFTTPEACETSIARFASGESRVSVRNWCWIRLAPDQPDPAVAALAPWFAQVVALAPDRPCNDHEPRTPAELDFRLAER